MKYFLGIFVVILISIIILVVRRARIEDEEMREKNTHLQRRIDELTSIRRAGEGMMNKTIICLCGSTRFTELMLMKQWELTKQGHIVLSWCALPDSYFKGESKPHVGDQEGVERIVDELHLRKIDLADEVLILNVDGYIGESTRNELEYARKHNKTIRFLEPGGELK